MSTAARAQVTYPAVSACSGASLPQSELTTVLTPLVNGIFTPLLPLDPTLLASTPGVVTTSTSGAPIGLNAVTSNGSALTPGSPCSSQANGFSLANPKGITIGGNSIDGLGATGQNANAGELGSIAVGNNAATAPAATNAVALGTGATANTPNGVALGAGSVDKAATPTTGVTLVGTPYTFAGAAPAGVVSVGSPGAERQIGNVAAGQLAAGSTDAVTGSQLFATNTALNTLANNVATGKVGAFVSDDSVTATPPVASGANALAGGFGASATGAGSAVVGNGATDNGVAGSTVVGQGATVGAGLAGSNVALGQGSVAARGAQTGYTAYDVAAPQTSIGELAVGTPAGARQISGVAAGSAATDAVNVAQLASALMGVQFGVDNPVQYDDDTHTSVTLGNPGAPVTVSNLAPGTLSPTSTQAVNGSQLYATNTAVNNFANGAAGAFQVYQSGAVVAPIASKPNATAGGDGAVASGVGSTAIGYHANASGANSVALGAGSTDGGQANVVSLGAPGAERRLTNVAPGINGTDGVNVNQLDLLAGAFNNTIQSVIRQDQAGDAVALAASGLRYDDRPGASSIAGGASYYGGHEGIAFGLAHTSGGGNWRYNIAASFVTPEDRADVGVIAGVSYTFAH